MSPEAVEPTSGATRGRTFIGRLLRPLRDQSPEEREHRRQRILITGPVGSFTGVLFGALASGRWNLPALPLVIGAGAGGFLLMYVSALLETYLRVRIREGGSRRLGLVAFGVDLAGGALLGRFMGAVLGADALASLAAGATSLFVVSHVAGRLIFGDWVDRAVALLSGHMPVARKPDYSYEESLVARGRLEEALHALLVASEERGDDPAPLLKGAWFLRQAGRPQEAVSWYGDALGRKKIDARRAAAAARHILELSSSRLGQPRAALPYLDTLLTRYPDSVDTAWARSIAEALRAEPEGEEPRLLEGG